MADYVFGVKAQDVEEAAPRRGLHDVGRTVDGQLELHDALLPPTWAPAWAAA